MADLRIGVSGWSYPHWRGGAFYPAGLPQSRELAYLSRRVNSLEINGSFYSLLTPQAYARFRDAAPAGFLFAVKGSRFITHVKQLAGVETPLANFFASGVLRLEGKLGPVLWQLPARRVPLERLVRFLELLPRDTAAASRLAGRHDDRVRGRASWVVHGNRRLRHALEVRHRDSLSPEVARLCRDRNVALVFADSGSWPATEELTSGFVYLRLHGSPATYASEYGAARLAAWARKVRAWSGGGEPAGAARITGWKPPARKGRDVYVYFDNDGEAHAPHDALRLMELLGVDALGERRVSSRRPPAGPRC